jgi:benzoylformate decarboxylase
MDRRVELVAQAPFSAGSTLTVRDAVFRLLRAFGMTSVFGNPGSTELPMFIDFPEDFRYVL